jgi:hypothetical protein
MRQFKVDRLLIQVLPQLPAQEGGGGCQSACSLNLTTYTQGCCAGGCSNVPSGACFPCSEITQVKFISEMDAAELPALRIRLEEALARVEVQQRVMDEVMAPRNLSEVSELADQLQAALERVQAMRRAMEEERGEDNA